MMSQLFPRELNRPQYLLRIILYSVVVFSIYSIVAGAIAVETISLLVLAVQIPIALVPYSLDDSVPRQHFPNSPIHPAV